MAHAQFVRELRALIRAPYALIHIETHEELRAMSLLHNLANSLELALYDWSMVMGLDRKPNQGDLPTALSQIEAFEEPAIFVLKDVQDSLNDPWTRRRLREVEMHCASNHKTIIFLGPERVELDNLDKDITRLVMPLPNRAMLKALCDEVVPATEQSIDRESLVSGAMGLTKKEAHRAFYRVYQQYQEARQRNAIFDLEDSILREKQRIIGKNDALEFHPLREGLGDVGGLDRLKQWLNERQEAFSEEAQAFGLPAPKGLLLVGVQGCGKSLTAKVIARHWRLPLLRLDLGNVFDGRKSAEEALREALRTSEAIAPCVLWLDEIEKGFAQDQEGRATRVLGSMLTWLQEKTQPVFMVATANQIDVLPPELLRKGRFDEIFFIDLPDQHEREAILNIHLTRRQRLLSPEQVRELAQKCEFFSGAELEQVIISGMYTAFAMKRELQPDDLMFAARETVPLYRTYEDQIKKLREWANTRARPASQKRQVIDYFGS